MENTGKLFAVRSTTFNMAAPLRTEVNNSQKFALTLVFTYSTAAVWCLY